MGWRSFCLRWTYGESVAFPRLQGYAPLRSVARIRSVFFLPRPDLPETPDALAAALEEGLRLFVSSPAKMVSVRGNKLRALDAIRIDLSGASVDSLGPRSRPQLSNRQPAMSVGELAVKGEPISLFNGEVAFALNATSVEFQQARQPDGNLLLVVQRAASGDVRIETTRAALERLIARAAGKLAQKQGVTIDNVKLDVSQPQPLVLNARVTVTARKLLFRAVLNLSGTISVSDDLVATISDLNCRGDGAIASLACAAITPQFARIERRPFPLSALPLGEMELREVVLNVGEDRIAAGAKFGASSPPA
jgi:hypothetical protein